MILKKIRDGHPSLRSILISIVFIYSETIVANENSISFSNTISIDSNNNFLWLDNSEKSREGIFIKPSLRYQNSSEHSKFQIGANYSIDTFNRDFFNTKNPSGDLSYNINSEKNSFGILIAGQQQSSRTTEIDNSGELQEELSQKNIAKSILNWEHSVNLKNSITVDLYGQNIQYESQNLVDYNLFGSNLSWRNKLSETLEITGSYRASNYQSDFFSYFFISEMVIDNITIAPHKPVDYGKAVTVSWTQDVGLGVKWDISEKTDISFNSGISKIDTTQEINTPEQTVDLKFPLSGEFTFDGKRKIQSNEQISNFDFSMNYLNFNSEYRLIARKGSRVSDIGSIQKSQSLLFIFNRKLTKRDDISLVVDWGRLNILDDDIVSLGYLNSRDYYQAKISWKKILTEYWIINSNIQFFGHQYSNVDIDAKGLSGTLSIIFHPKSKIW